MKATRLVGVVLFVIIMCLFLSACRPSNIVRGSTYGYTLGYMKEDYNLSFEEAWRACERTIASLKGYDVVPERYLGKGTIKATIVNDVVRFYITYKSQDSTEIVVRVGYVGDEVASKLIHDKIKENIEKN